MTTSEESRDRVRRILEHELARVDSPEAAEEIVKRLESLAGERTEEETAQQAANRPVAAAADVEQAAQSSESAAVLATAAAQAVAPTPEAPAVGKGAREALVAPPAHAPEAARRGRSYLRQAVIRRLGPLQALDARLYLAINELPHPRWFNRLVYAITLLATGGWFWVFGVLVAFLLRVPKSWRALKQLLPSLVGATWIVEYPVKEGFRRRRPFINVVRALVVGRKPGSWSFPSGHTASSFAGAWVLSAIWPRRSPIFFALAWFVGFSRVYVGAHYPGDVTAGGLLGMLLAEVIRRGARRVLG